MKDTLIEIKNNLQGNNIRVNEAKDHINDLEHKEATPPPPHTQKKQSRQQEEKTIQQNEENISSLWDNFKHSNIHIIGVPEEEREQDIGNYLRK